MTLIELINADKICANQLFLRKSASRFLYPVAHESVWRTVLKIGCIHGYGKEHGFTSIAKSHRNREFCVLISVMVKRKKSIFRDAASEISQKCGFLDFTLILINTKPGIFVGRISLSVTDGR